MTLQSKTVLTPTFDFLSGGGEMGALMRAHDWSNSFLGQPDTWPSSLKTSLRLVLTSRHPMFIWWGPNLLQFYNDAYRETLGPERHPSALGQAGRACWEEVWHLIGPDIAHVMAGLGATWHENTLVPLTRHGRRENVWWTYGYSPIEDESGVRGVMVICMDVTAEHLQKETLKKSYYSLIQALDQGFCVVEPLFDASGRAVDYRFLETNQAFKMQSGLHDVTGKTAKELVPGLEGHWIETYGRVALTGEPVRFEEEAAAMERWFDVYATRVGGAESRQVAVLFTDISERKKIEKQLRKNGERQALSLELTDLVQHLSSPEEIITAACELLGSRFDVSRVLYGEIGVDTESVLIRCNWTAKDVVSVAGLSTRLSQFGPGIAVALRAGEVVINNDVLLDSRTAECCDAYEAVGVRSQLVVPLIKSGRLILVVGFHRPAPSIWSAEEVELAQDLAERTWSAVEVARAQAELRSERDQSQYIFDSMTEGFALVDSNWTVLRVNAEGLRITQRVIDDVVGHNHWDVWQELKGTMIEAFYSQVKQTQKAGIIEIPYVFPNQRNGWVEIRAYPALDGGLAFFFRDISERKATQEKLQDTDRRKDEFLAMLAHELRNPLAPIGAAAELLKFAKLNEAQVRQTSQIIDRQVKHMTSLVDDLLDVSRVTRGLVKLNNASHNLSHIVTDAIEQVAPLIRLRRHHLALHLTPAAMFVQGDRKRLVQVLTNILNNAAKYTPEGGNIQLRTEVDAQSSFIEITDTGIGMEHQLVARAFDLFAQAERSVDRSSGGLGLGLALVKTLVELHHGTVRCESDGVGTGSTFTVCLPRLQVEEGYDNHQHDNAGVEKKTPSLRILVVDDNVDAATMLTMLLEAYGHDVLVEHGALRALERAKADRPQVCLLDIGLPEIDGNELAQRLRSQTETAGSVLIAITGYGQEKDREKTLASGFDHHLVKPVDAEKLAALLATVGSSKIS